jgi:two-component system, OmpR family, sensor histidine kinase VicK
MAKKFSFSKAFKKCGKYNIPLWQCPEFLFLVMGIVIIIASLVFYAIGGRYIKDPRMVALMVTIVTMLLLIIAFIITHSFENLAEADRMKAEFVSIVSHQLRAPLTNLRWTIQFLTPEKMGQLKKRETEDYFSIIEENSTRMEKLVNDLLIVARLQEGKIDNKKISFPLPSLIKEIVKENHSFIEAKNLKVKTMTLPNSSNVFANYPLAKIVVENLVNNAIIYNKKDGEIKIRIEKKGNNILFTIQDQGIGIPAKDKKYIFQKFFRAKNAVVKEFYGTGLGLFIVKMILGTMKGKIWLKSKEGEGATFYITLPAALKQPTTNN